MEFLGIRLHSAIREGVTARVRRSRRAFFQLPLFLLNRSRNLWTLPLFQYNFKTEYSFDYPMAFTAYLISMVPMLVIYCLCQKHIISGLTAGAVKS